MSGRWVGSSQEMKKGFGARSDSSKRDMVATFHVRLLPSGSLRSMGLYICFKRLEVASAPSEVSMQKVSSSQGLSFLRGVSLTYLHASTSTACARQCGQVNLVSILKWVSLPHSIRNAVKYACDCKADAVLLSYYGCIHGELAPAPINVVGNLLIEDSSYL